MDNRVLLKIEKFLDKYAVAGEPGNQKYKKYILERADTDDDPIEMGVVSYQEAIDSVQELFQKDAYRNYGIGFRKNNDEGQFIEFNRFTNGDSILLSLHDIGYLKSFNSNLLVTESEMPIVIKLLKTFWVSSDNAVTYDKRSFKRRMFDAVLFWIIVIGIIWFLYK